jgi:hypothetical protein
LARYLLNEGANVFAKVYGDYIMRNYHTCYGLKTIIFRGFNRGVAESIHIVCANELSQFT